jgi:hypothetical protein
VRSLNFFQGMALVSAERDASLRNFARIGAVPRLTAGNASNANAGLSRLILFGFYIDKTTRAGLLNTPIIAIGKCIRAAMRLCSTSRHRCTAGSDLV